ncbi:MAG: NUDIX domain-containing protein [Gemmatimonadota bacterium]|nr:NUDIX domain-containing protein [Gemmatimonadota bacterium]
MTERIEREELSRGQLSAGSEPPAPRPAATLVLARDRGADPWEVLLLRRPYTARFAAGAYVFPGGVIDAADGDPDLAARLRPDAEGRFGGTEPAALAAALRELLEETGLLLADRDPGPDAVAKLRHALLAGETDLAAAARRSGLEFRDLRTAYFARWVTPRRFARRYDTRFFLAVLPPERASFEPVLTDELAGHVWLPPAEAVRRFREGRLPMLFPTRTTLGQLAAHATLDALFAWCRARRVEPVTPRLLVRDDLVRPVLPGDPDWDAAAD